MSSLWQLTGSKQSALLPVAGHASTYTVGRKDQDVTIDGDKSISRAHCMLEVGADNTLYVTDPGSKFGTFVNGTKLEHHARTALAAGATLKVGETAFEVARVPLVFRDYCAHILIPLNQCRVKTWYSPWKCTDLRHSYEKCQFDEYERRVAIARQEQAGGGDDERPSFHPSPSSG